MKCRKQSFAIVPVLCAVLLSLLSLVVSTGTLKARDADRSSLTFASARTAKQQCIIPVVHDIATAGPGSRCHPSSVGTFTRTASASLVMLCGDD